MNKTEALVALLEKARQWEAPTAEVRATPPERVMEVLERNYARLADLLDASPKPDVRAELICIGAAALYLLIDDVQVVEGRDLDAWLAGGEPAISFVSDGKPRAPRPVNGQIGREL